MTTRMRQAFAVAALAVTTGHATAEVLTLSCRGAIGEEASTDFSVDLDLAAADVTDANVRWMTTDGDTTIDWDLDRHGKLVRAVFLTGPDAGLMISGECDVPASATELLLRQT